ncbi:uncharacterized protein LOC141849381 [Brevipalpus obovatus]|uniref:uncharacterized protein LOC141849381 n=1 Tax=Brevipalpus obovatus TaxID=246614 RepID=UPI003D9F3276
MQKKLSPQLANASRYSFVNTISKFIQEVDHMNDVVLVPTKLSDCEAKNVSECPDLYSLHTLLNRLKDELVSSRLAESDSQQGRGTIIRQNNNNNTIQNSNHSVRNQAQMMSMETSKYASSCSDDDGFSSLTSYRQTSSASSCDDESMDSDSLYSDPCADKSSPEFIVNCLRSHLQGIESLLNTFSSLTNDVSEGYLSSLQLED